MTRSSTSAKAASKEAAGTAQAASISYEHALGELERLVAVMEAGQLPLDQLLESYRRGAELLGFCRSRLQAVEQQVKVLEGEELKQWGES
ncbi:exodeoxyribonuclease VII small subunit [Paucibacter sp. B2R-40]|uniref:exodeoxyribonuclease VII small subunit n=1 Tax=Paucibacter sp. B2R-40 TaxID=2893554 RepID=UPI0021E4A561|nr:exodeoxyribonuclease VII small subunit [Paucibacter sp. B2R-40]MCV2354375.1 exodeoxyribonuclease VII small subunit [Paucibacter sp. B2R-40]